MGAADHQAVGMPRPSRGSAGGTARSAWGDTMKWGLALTLVLHASAMVMGFSARRPVGSRSRPALTSKLRQVLAAPVSNGTFAHPGVISAEKAGFSWSCDFGKNEINRHSFRAPSPPPPPPLQHAKGVPC